MAKKCRVAQGPLVAEDTHLCLPGIWIGEIVNENGNEGIGKRIAGGIWSDGAVIGKREKERKKSVF